MADTPLIGWTVHGQGTVIWAGKTGPHTLCTAHKGDAESVELFIFVFEGYDFYGKYLKCAGVT